jgi:hypothetical protein
MYEQQKGRIEIQGKLYRYGNATYGDERKKET